MWHSYWSIRPYPKRFWRSFCLFLLFCDSCYFQISEIPGTSSFKGKKSQSPISTKQNQRSWWSSELSTDKYEYRLILMKCFSLRVLIYNYMYIFHILHAHDMRFQKCTHCYFKIHNQFKENTSIKFIILCLKVYIV